MNRNSLSLIFGKCRQSRPTFWSTRHSHGRIFAPIFFNFSGKVWSCLPTLTKIYFLNPLINSAKMAERVFRKSQNWPQKVRFFNFFQIGAILASLSTDSGRLNNNMSIFCLLSSSFLVKMAENRKCRQSRPTFWSTRHSHGRIFAPIFFKFSGKLQSCLPTFTIKKKN